MSELRHSVRRLCRTPGFTAASLLTLALAIAANVAIFTLLYQVVLSPLPYPAADRLVALDHAAPGVELQSDVGMSVGLYREYGALPSTEAIALYQGGQGTLTGSGEPERLDYLFATPSLGGIIGARPALGRWFTEADGRPDAPLVMVLTHGFWQSRFGGSAAALGTWVQLDGRSFEIVGVMPPGFAFPDGRAQFFTPLQLDLANATPAGFNYRGIARVAPGVNTEQLRAQQNAVIEDLPSRFPGDEVAQALAGDVDLSSLAVPMKEAVLGGVARTLWILLAAVIIVLLIACANLANLFLVRVDARRREVAVRRALGAGPRRIAGFFLTETLVLALASGVVGVLIAALAVDLLVARAPVELPRLHEVRIDAISGACAAGLTLLAGLAFGLLPLLRPFASLSSVLQESARGNTVGAATLRGRQLLMAGQVTLATVLLVGATFVLQSFQRVQAVDPGFRSDSRLIFRLGISGTDYPDREDAAQFQERVLERVRALPGVRTAALATTLPLHGDGQGDPIVVRNRPTAPGEFGAVMRYRRVSADYLRTLAVPLLEGRPFDERDDRGIENVVLLDEAAAASYFPGESPIGQQVRPIDDGTGWHTVVGVVGNTATSGLTEESVTGKVYFPLRSPQPAGTPSLHTVSYVVHTSGDPLAIIPAVRRAVAQLDARVALAQPEAFHTAVARSNARMAFTLVLLLLAGGIALLLGIVGVYAVISYSVAQRTGEIGVRLALGAAPAGVAGLVLRQSATVIAAGIAAGLLCSIAAARAMQSLLFGVTWRQPGTYVLVGTALLLTALLASWIPARRAARISPLDSLR